MLCGLALAVAGEARAQSAPATPKAAPAPAAPAVDPARTMYALGVLLSGPLESFTLSPAELEQVLAGVRDGVQKKSTLPNPEAYGPRIQELQNTRAAAPAAKQKKIGNPYTANAAAARGRRGTPQGGPRPGPPPHRATRAPPAAS